VWVAPTVVGLDWTSDAWVKSLPVYTVEAAPQRDILISTTELPESQVVGGLEAEGLAPTVSPEASMKAQTVSAVGSPLKVTGKFVTPLSDDTYAGADTALTGIVWGWVDIYRCSDDSYLGGGFTKAGKSAGKFSITIPNPVSEGFYVYITPCSGAGCIEAPGGDWQSYGTFAGCFYSSSGATSYSIGTWSIYDGSGYVYRLAWMIYESVVNDKRKWGAWNLFRNKLSPSWDMGYVVVRFPYETWAHYHPGGEIHLPTANDARSPDVIQHEYGHFAMYTTYGTSFTTNCPSPHYINLWSHVNCAWSEGWASYVSYVTHNDKTYTYANNFEVNEETPTWGTSGWDYGDGVEGRVTAALIDLDDGQNECGGTPRTCDRVGGLRNKLWNTFQGWGLTTTFYDFIHHYSLWYGYPSTVDATLYHNTIDY